MGLLAHAGERDLCASVRAVVPGMSGPGPVNKAANNDDRVREIEVRIYHGGATFVAAGKPVEGVLPSMGPLGVPAVACLDRGLLASVRDSAVQAAFVEYGPGFVNQ